MIKKLMTFPKSLDDKTLKIIILIGIMTRVIIWLISIGSNDIDIWTEHASLVSQKGIVDAYRTPGRFNHPPLPSMYASWAWSFVEENLYRFGLFMKLPGLLGELIILFTIIKLYSLRTAAIYSILLAPILISSFHGNTDCLYAATLFLAAIFFEKNKFLLSGLLFALSLNVKLLPLVLFPVFIFSLPNFRNMILFSFGVLIGLTPFYPPALEAPFEMYRNMLKYNSTPENWGVHYFFNKLIDNSSFQALGLSLSSFYNMIGRFMIFGGITVLTLLSRFRWKLPFMYLIALCGSWFFLVTHGFAIQYIVLVCAPLLVSSENKGYIWGLYSGLFALSIYFLFSKNGFPIESIFTSKYPKYTKLFGLIPWLFLCTILYKFFKSHSKVKTFQS